MLATQRGFRMMINIPSRACTCSGPYRTDQSMAPEDSTVESEAAQAATDGWSLSCRYGQGIGEGCDVPPHHAMVHGVVKGIADGLFLGRHAVVQAP